MLNWKNHILVCCWLSSAATNISSLTKTRSSHTTCWKSACTRNNTHTCQRRRCLCSESIFTFDDWWAAVDIVVCCLRALSTRWWCTAGGGRLQGGHRETDRDSSAQGSRRQQEQNVWARARQSVYARDVCGHGRHRSAPLHTRSANHRQPTRTSLTVLFWRVYPAQITRLAAICGVLTSAFNPRLPLVFPLW